jgi:RpiB/LacA/LacB family sugar-phosphate isomerase
MAAVRVYVGSDHAGFSLRKKLALRLLGQGHDMVDLGPTSDAACDYPEYASAVGNAVHEQPGTLGVLVCATGQGMAIAASKVRGIRAVVPATVEAARLSRFDNNANVLCLGARLLAESDAFAIVDTWLATGFAGGRHARRIAKVAAIETASALAFVTESERLALATQGALARLFDRDASLFSSHRPGHAAIRKQLGWLALPSEMAPKLDEIATFVREIRRPPLKDLFLLVGEPKLAPAAAMAHACGPVGLRLHVVGASHEGGERAGATAVHKYLHPDTAFVLVVGKPGEGIEAAEEALWSKIVEKCGGDQDRAGRHFAAVSTVPAPLAEIAKTHRYRKLFLDPPGLAKGHGLLGFEGLVPAALLGHDLAQLMAGATGMAEACRKDRIEDNPGASLGVLLGAVAKHGRNKLTLLLSKSIHPLGAWIAELLTHASGECDRGIVTLQDDPLLPSYLPDRMFVHVQVEGDAPVATAEQVEALHLAGQPYIQIAVGKSHDLLAEIYRWQMAALVAAVVMGSNPFGR